MTQHIPLQIHLCLLPATPKTPLLFLKPRIQDSPPHSAGTDAPGPGGADEGSRDEQSTNLKRGAEGLEEQTAKRPRVASASSAGEGSFTTLRPHFLSLRLDERPQFLSWLFEGALASCTPDSDEGAPSAIRKDSRAETEETRAKRGDGKKGHGDKRWRWSAEEDARLSGHDGGASVLVGDREVFPGEDGIGPAPASVEASEGPKEDMSGQACRRNTGSSGCDITHVVHDIETKTMGARRYG
ncbi:conserved hypothetical protein [Coccidioides posadasii str. Silveira]|uniref:Uncharacterized protein n=1 Tax=Coccidioides posadasii (strain RMSCC 757 / Silveira) TaxID=443226 RepID=E9DC21_COCPS|nr:conserved hypothetical protein [Coccidioides posadasii str. Silveira]